MTTHSSILPGESRGQRCLAATVHGVTKSWARLKQLRTHAQMIVGGRLYVQSAWKKLLTWWLIPRSMFCKPKTQWSSKSAKTHAVSLLEIPNALY